MPLIAPTPMGREASAGMETHWQTSHAVRMIPRGTVPVLYPEPARAFTVSWAGIPSVRPHLCGRDPTTVQYPAQPLLAR